MAIIPARLASRRLPRKMLLDETGKALFEHTALNVASAAGIERVVVATDSEEVLERASAVGIEAVLTREDHASGTDRVFEALEALGGTARDFDVVLNVQGDEPELDTTDLDQLAAAFAAPEVRIATLCGPLHDEAEADAAQVVKVVMDQSGDALYFSRSVLPHRPDERGDHASDPLASYARDDAPAWLGHVRRHVGVYAFRPEALAEFCSLPRGPLERIENLEQLRWLEAGNRLRVLETSHVPLGIDTRADYDAFRARVRGGATASSPGS